VSSAYQILFGDIHNHNALGYGIGSLERSIDIARSHLDFFSFTGHSSWHDMEPMEGGRERRWVDGFHRLETGWPKVQELIAEANRDDQFTAFLGFEWHSSSFGDQCVIFPNDHQPLFAPDHINRLRQFCRERNALMIPHHLAYPEGMRGVNWKVFDSSCTPIVEIFSEHGNSEDDRGPFPYFNHSMGGRQTSHTVQAALAKGLKFGFCASSDSHNGFPGGYGEGLMAVQSLGHSRPAIFEAIKARRTYALTGDRIYVEFEVDGSPMGSGIIVGRQASVHYNVCCPDEIDIVELIQDGHVVHRHFPVTRINFEDAVSHPFKLRLEWGWGPWGDLALDRITDWEFSIHISDGKLLNYYPCIQSGPFDEDRRHSFTTNSETDLHIRSYSGRAGAYRQNPNQSAVLEISGGSSTVINLQLMQPRQISNSVDIRQLFAGSQHFRTGPFPKESYQWHRLVPMQSSCIEGQYTVDMVDQISYIYLRAREKNGHHAWASPVYMNRA